MTDIIRESGLSSGSIYSHFSGKGDILYATVQQRIDMIAAAYGELKDPSPRDIMRMIFATSTVEANFTSMPAHPFGIVYRSRGARIHQHAFYHPARYRRSITYTLGSAVILKQRINANLLPTNFKPSSTTQRMRSSSLSRGLWCAQPCRPRPTVSTFSRLR